MRVEGVEDRVIGVGVVTAAEFFALVLLGGGRPVHGRALLAVLLGEVSQCNDDNTDNRFNPPVGRFPKIEEDEAPYRLLCNEYPAAKETAPQ